MYNRGEKMKIRDYLGETTLYEKKEKVEKNKVKNWLKTVSAFANGKVEC